MMPGEGEGGVSSIGPDGEESASAETGFELGQKVDVAGRLGVVRFLGETKFAEGQWVGIELDEASGKSDGEVQGVRYFSCAPQRGLFVRSTCVKAAASDSAADGSAGGTVTAAPPHLSAPDTTASAGGAIRSKRRCGISAGHLTSLSQAEEAAWVPPVHPKTAAERQLLCDIIRTSHDTKLKMMFGNVTAETSDQVIDAMFAKTVKQGEHVIRLGDMGDFFYIVKSGTFDILVRPRGSAGVPQEAVATAADPDSKTNEPKLVKVFEATVGYAFGELALLYQVPRNATIIAKEDSEVWCLERDAFRRLIVGSSERQFKRYVEFLRGCDIFHELDPTEIASLAEVLEEEDFENHEAILTQGDRDRVLYILRLGSAVACITGEQGEVEVKSYSVGDYFGELALLTGEPRQASVYSVGRSNCLYLSTETFSRILGPLRDFLQRNVAKYEKYQDAIRRGNEADARKHSDQSDLDQVTRRLSDHSDRSEDLVDALPRRRNSEALEVFDGTSALTKTLSEAGADAASRRNRYRRIRTFFQPEDDPADAQPLEEAKGALDEAAQSTEAERRTDTGVEAAVSDVSPEGDSAGGTSSDDKGKDDAEPTSLAEKVAQDFKNTQLVTPCKAFMVPTAKVQVFGGLRLGEKFTVDKSVVAVTEVAPARDDLADVYSWSGPCWLKGSTHIAVLCQKGQKSPSDPTPNQDNYFVLQVGGIGIYGVCDGHGPFGHLVSFRLVQALPHLVTTSPHFGKDWKLALKEAFLGAQEDLLAWCKEHEVNIEASGAAGTVVVFEGPAVHVAHIGDSSAMIASWNRRDSRVVYGSADHKPGNPEERSRLEAAGMEVRQVDEDSFRIFQPGTNFPGLTMSRAFGDTACLGVLREPEYKELRLQPSDEWYAVIASDGIWEFIDFQQAVDLSAKKLRLKGTRETVRFLTDASRKRWSYACGEYCDDITAILVQWNVSEKNNDSDVNYTLSVRRHD